MKLAILLLLAAAAPLLAEQCPGRISVGAYIYQIVVDDPGPKLLGSVNYERQVIIIDREAPSDRKREVLVHELMHIAAWQSLGRTADYFKSHKYKEDQFIEATAPILIQTLQRYPQLLTCEVK